MAVANAFDTLVERVVATPDLPPAVVARAQAVVLDSLGAICAGLALPETRALRDGAPEAAEATLIGRAARSTVEWATLVHGSAGTATELDEGHAFARGHPAMHVLPAALALAEAQGSGGAAFLRALILGYEVAARVGMATTLRPEVHPHGTWGTVGAAVAAGILLDYDGATVGEAARIAGALTLAPAFQAAFEGASVRDAYAGCSGQLGLTAARLARSGFGGLREGPAEVLGRVLGTGFEPELMLEGLGERWEIERGYFKVHACCRFNHAALDALAALRAREPIAGGQVEQVDVATYAAAARLRDQDPATPLAARFSVPFAIATALISGHTGPAAFDPAAVADVGIRALARRVSVREEPAFSAMGPARRPARVTITLRDGRQLTEVVFGSKGDPDQPVTSDELKSKFLALATPVLGEDRAAQVVRATARLKEMCSVDELTALLRGE